MKWLKKVQKKRSFELPAVIAQMFVHKRKSKIDQDAIKDLERSIRGMEELADVHALRCAIKLCCLFRNLSLGRRLTKRLLTMPGGEFSRPLLGWLEIARQDFKMSTLGTALQHFEESLRGKRARFDGDAYPVIRSLHAFTYKKCYKMLILSLFFVFCAAHSVANGRSTLCSASRCVSKCSRK